jgi:ketosteroid isomerase-like protein
MKSTIRVAIAAIGLFTGAALAHPSARTAQQEIQAQMEEMLSAANARDTDRYMMSYAKSPELVFTFNDMTMVGWQTFRDQQLKWWDYGNAQGSYSKRQDAVIKVLGKDLAVTVQALVSHRPMPDGTTRDTNLSATSIWKKTSNGWRILAAHESSSPPQVAPK